MTLGKPEAPSENASVRVWNDLLARIRFGTVRVGKRTLSSATIKSVATRISSYADSDGSRVRPGLARVAVDLERDYGTVKNCVGVLRNIGLLRLVKPGKRAGIADTYQLTIPVDLLDREDVEVWSPARHALEVERTRDKNRGIYKPAKPAPSDDPGDLQAPEAPADMDYSPDLTPVDNPDLQVPCAPAVASIAEKPAGAYGAQKSDLQVPGEQICGCPMHPLPTSDRVTETTEPEIRAVRTGLEVVAHARPAEDPIFDGVDTTERPPLMLVPDGSEPAATADHDPLPESGKCPHSLPATTHDNGIPTCPLCRLEKPGLFAVSRTPTPTHLTAELNSQVDAVVNAYIDAYETAGGRCTTAWRTSIGRQARPLLAAGTPFDAVLAAARHIGQFGQQDLGAHLAETDPAADERATS